MQTDLEWIGADGVLGLGFQPSFRDVQNDKAFDSLLYSMQKYRGSSRIAFAIFLNRNELDSNESRALPSQIQFFRKNSRLVPLSGLSYFRLRFDAGGLHFNYYLPDFRGLRLLRQAIRVGGRNESSGASNRSTSRNNTSSAANRRRTSLAAAAEWMREEVHLGPREHRFERGDGEREELEKN